MARRKFNESVDSERRRAKSAVRSDLESAGVRPSKNRGQNFLLDQSVLESILEFGDVSEGERALEIGPGLGALTERLYPLGSLTVIEIETGFCKSLKERFPDLNVICADVREFDLKTVEGPLVVFGNLPYVYSTEIIFKLLQAGSHIKRAVLLLQKEFAERLAAEPGGRDYGSISVAVQLLCSAQLGRLVPGNSFHPPTQVTSRIIRLDFLDAPRFDVGSRELFETVVRAAFRQRRKKIVNSMASAGRWSREEIDAALQKAGIEPGRRAETVSVEEYANLARSIAP